MLRAVTATTDAVRIGKQHQYEYNGAGETYKNTLYIIYLYWTRRSGIQQTSLITKISMFA